MCVHIYADMIAPIKHGSLKVFCACEHISGLQASFTRSPAALNAHILAYVSSSSQKVNLDQYFL